VEVLCERVVVVAGGWLAGLAEAPAVIGNDSVTSIQEDRDLLLPRSTAQRVPVDENDRLARAMVFVVKVDVARIFFSDCNVWHCFSLFSLAMNKFLIGRVVTAIDYTLIQFSIRLAVATTLTTRLSSLFMAVLPW
jgi:hypothetical protein